MTSSKLVVAALLMISYLVCLSVGQQYGLPFGCGEDEEFQQCGPRCPRSCSNLLQMYRPMPMCSGCNPGCFCKPQYVRNEAGKCVTPQQCGFNN